MELLNLVVLFTLPQNLPFKQNLWGNWMHQPVTHFSNSFMLWNWYDYQLCSVNNRQLWMFLDALAHVYVNRINIVQQYLSSLSVSSNGRTKDRDVHVVDSREDFFFLNNWNDRCKKDRNIWMLTQDVVFGIVYIRWWFIMLMGRMCFFFRFKRIL